MDQIKEAFQKVKQDIIFLKEEINSLRLNLNEIKEQIVVLNSSTPSTLRQLNSTHPTHPSTHNLPLEALKDQNMPISSGNQGGRVIKVLKC